MNTYYNSTREIQTTKGNNFYTLWIFTLCFLIFGNQLSAQDIDVRGYDGSNYVSITNGDMTPSTADGTDGGTDGGGKRIGYRIYNVGASDLMLTGNPIVSLSGDHPQDFEISFSPSNTTISPNRNEYFEVTFKPTEVGVRTAIVSIANNDADENPFTFKIQVTAVAEPKPVIFGLTDHSIVQYYKRQSYFPLSISSYSAGSPFEGRGTQFNNVKINDDSRCSAYLIENQGLADITFSSTPITLSGEDASDFSIAKMPTSATLAGGGKDTVLSNLSVLWNPNIPFRERYFNIFCYKLTVYLKANSTFISSIITKFLGEKSNLKSRE